MDRQATTARQVSPLFWSVGSVYVLVVTVLAASGFIIDSTPPILLAAFLSLPASAIALPGFYMAYGLLALVPGANPSVISSSTRSCTADGVCSRSTIGDQATWFVVTTDAIGVLALTCAALLNLLAIKILADRRRSGVRSALPLLIKGEAPGNALGDGASDQERRTHRDAGPADE
ncbi:hypothetical protein [Nocardioides jejuensis]|uniref:Uncharacterized protein n=1 Tax=Nocardioides jejuensis TaxID=2502782 RepID=A0A4R1C128_9ACTN|nr:hypothetical protein [Nocardioides jejuensis]TCJ23698.1 hypothetical protein EPD65_10540 [Nocardioides jejuensis]